MKAGAIEDVKPVLEPQPTVKNITAGAAVAGRATCSIQSQREPRRKSFAGRVQFRDALDSIVRMG